MGNLVDVVPIVALLTKYVGGLIASVIIGVLMIIARWKIFEKAGEPGWKSIIPIYSEYVYCRIVWEVEAFWKMFLYSFGVIALAVLTARGRVYAKRRIQKITNGQHPKNSKRCKQDVNSRICHPCTSSLTDFPH